MTISKWMTAGTVLKMMAMQCPDKQGAADKFRKMTFKEWNERSCRLTNALNAMGVKKEIALPYWLTSSSSGWKFMQRLQRVSLVLMQKQLKESRQDASQPLVVE